MVWLVLMGTRGMKPSGFERNVLEVSMGHPGGPI